MKYGLLLASHIIEEWRQYYISYDVLKTTIDSLKSQVYGTDDAASAVSVETISTKCSILTSIFFYCFECCLSKSHDADVIEQHEETLLIHRRSQTSLDITHIGSDGLRSPSAKRKKHHRHYASLRAPFKLVQNPKPPPTTKAHSSHSSLTNEKEEKQSLIDHAYSPPVSTYSHKEAIKLEAEHKNNGSVQGYLFDKEHQRKLAIDKVNSFYSKSLAIDKWQEIIHQESDKVNTFYLNIESQLLSEYEQILHKIDKLYKVFQAKHMSLDFNAEASPLSLHNTLNASLSNLANESHSDKKEMGLLEPLKIPNKYKKRNIHLYQMKLNIFILYQRFIALSNFRTLNQIGFRKILKKFDKNFKALQQKKIMKEINGLDFVESTQCRLCMNDLIVAYSNLFEGGDFHKAKVKLLESISWSKWSASSSFKVGLKIGVMLGLIVWTILAMSARTLHSLPANAVYSYRAIGCFLAFLWFWSADVYIWSKYRINFVFIFEFEPRTRLTFLQYFDEAATLSLIYFINCVIFIKSVDWMPHKYVTIWPTALLIFFIMRLFLPVFDYWKSRQCIIDALMQTVIAPFGRVRFRDFFMGDVLTSLVKVIADLYLAICVVSLEEYYTRTDDSFCLSSMTTKIIKPICICAPYWFRFAQCLNRYFNTHDRVPHLPNAVKYGTAMSVTLLGTLHTSYGTVEGTSWSSGRIIWLIATVVSTCYLIFWDTTMDWTLFKKNRSKEYPKWWYWTAMGLDIVLRYLWTFTLFPTSANPYFHGSASFTFLDAAYFMAFIEIAELFRRAVWAIFRVENAHVSRKDEFRSYEYVPLFYEHTTLIEEQTKANKPTSMILETISIFLLVLVITIIIVLTSD